MKLVQKKQIGLNYPLSDFYPEFSKGKKQSITIEHLLTHTSGLKPYIEFHKMDGYPSIYEAQLEYCVFPFKEQTEFVQAITNTDLHRDDPVEGYREYYRKEKAHFCTWKHGDIPEWFNNAA